MTTDPQTLVPPRLGRGWDCHLDTRPDLCGCDLLLVIDAPSGWTRDYAPLDPTDGEGLDIQDHHGWKTKLSKIAKWAQSRGLTLGMADVIHGYWRPVECDESPNCRLCSTWCEPERVDRKGKPYELLPAAIRYPLAPVGGAE